MATDYPFPFYGYGYSGDNASKLFFEIKFESTLQILADPGPLAVCVESALHVAHDQELACRVECEKWLWSDDWALLRFKQSDPSISDDDYPLATHIASVFEAVHEESPLIVVVSLDAPADWEWNWHDETVAKKRMPSKAPTWKRRGIKLPTGVYAKRPRFEAETSYNDEFEKLRRQLRRDNDMM